MGSSSEILKPFENGEFWKSVPNNPLHPVTIIGDILVAVGLGRKIVYNNAVISSVSGNRGPVVSVYVDSRLTSVLSLLDRDPDYCSLVADSSREGADPALIRQKTLELLDKKLIASMEDPSFADKLRSVSNGKSTAPVTVR